MRTIKFRGKRITDGKWIFGSLLGDEDYAIYYRDGVNGWRFTYVDPETVGQYTGMKDPQGVEIYEGDIVYNAQLEFAEVKYENGAFWIYSPVQNICTRVSNLDCVNGNKYDNPELLTDKPWKQ